MKDYFKLLDANIIAFLHPYGNRRLAKWVSRTGDGYLVVLAPIIAFAMQLDKARFYLQVIMIAYAVERLIYFCLKNYFKRRRPEKIIPKFSPHVIASDEFSFPSGHTSAAFLLVLLTNWVYEPSLIVLSLLFIWSVLVGFSRLLVGVHFITDVVAGAILAYACFIAVKLITLRFLI